MEQQISVRLIYYKEENLWGAGLSDKSMGSIIRYCLFAYLKGTSVTRGKNL